MINNTSNSYGLVAIVLHWVMALMIFGLFGLGLYMDGLTYYDAWYRGSLDLHKSLGITLMLLWLGRVIWRWRSTTPSPVGSAVEQKVSHWVHRILYLLLLILMFSGYLISTADGRAISVFGLFDVPALPISFEQQEDIAGEVHEWLAWVLIALAVLHALAALKHHILDKDNTLLRMTRPEK